MTYDCIRTIHADGRITVRHLAFSQMVAMLRDLDKETKDAFWQQTETRLPNGDSVYLVQEGV
jgi:hypothetical protein